MHQLSPGRGGPIEFRNAPPTGTGPTNADIRDAIEKAGSAFENFKQANDERLKAIEAKRGVDPLVEEKLSKINGDLDKFEKFKVELDRQLKSLAEASERVESKINKKGLGGGLETATEERKVYFQGLRRGFDKLDAAEVKVMKVSDDTTGGYLAPLDYVREIIKAVVEFSPMRPLVRVRQTTQRSVQQPKRTGTFSARWVGEVATRTETTGLQYGLVEIPTHEMTAEVYISFADLEDSAFDLPTELNAEFAEQFGVAEGTAIVNGSGVGKPYGLLNTASIVNTNSGGATITADSLVVVHYSLKTAYAMNATWILNRKSIGAVRKLKDTTGQYLWQPGLAALVPNTILGSVYTEVPDMADEGSGAVPIGYGDWARGYVLADRLNLAVVRDPFTLAGVGQVKFVARRRLGGQGVLGEAMATLTCS